MRWGDLSENEQTGVLVAGAGVVLLALWKGQEIVATTADLITRGNQLTSTTLNDDDYSPFVEVDPQDLADAAAATMGQDLAHDPYSAVGVYALARMARSEADPRDTNASRLARMHVALNDAKELGWSLPKLFTYSKKDNANGFFGQQRGRRYSTARDPYEGDVRLAWFAIDQDIQGIDPTGGAVKFVDKDSMGKQKGSGSFDDLVERWAGEGLEPYNLPGLGENFVVFRRA